MRFLLRRRLLTGIELVRRVDHTDWVKLHDTALFKEEVPNMGEPAVIAHRRKLRRWLVPGLSMAAWLGLFSMLMIADTPGAEDFVPVVVILGMFPAAMLALWTFRFRESLAIVLGRADTQPAAQPAERVPEPALLPDLDFAGGIDLDALRAELEVLRDCREHSDNPTEFETEEQNLRERLDLAEQALSAIEAFREA